MMRITQKIKGIVAARGIGIFRGAARVADTDPKSVFLAPDGSWGWPLRILILCAAFVIAALIALYFADDIIRPLLSHHRRRTISNAEYGEIIGNYQLILSAVTVGLFSVTFGLGYWVIKSHDVKRATRDRFREMHERLLSDALHSLSEKTGSDASFRKAHGLRELARLVHQGAIEEERIHAITRDRQDLRGVNLGNAALAGLDLKDAQLSDALLEDADLSRANLSRAKLMGANLNGAQLTSTCMADADLSEAQLIETKLKEAVLTGARLHGADLSGANLKGADLRAARLAETNLFRADLSEADLSGADLSGADLSGAVLSSVDLSEADLSGADLSGARLSGTDLSGVDLSGADLSGVVFPAVRLAGTDLRMSDVCGADLMHADLNGVDARGALYDENTEFPEDFDPEKHGLQSLGSND